MFDTFAPILTTVLPLVLVDSLAVPVLVFKVELVLVLDDNTVVFSMRRSSKRAPA